MPGDVERCPGPGMCLAGRACLLHPLVLAKLGSRTEQKAGAGLVRAGSGSAASSEEGTVVWEPQSQVPPPAHSSDLPSRAVLPARGLAARLTPATRCPRLPRLASRWVAPGPCLPPTGLCTASAFSSSAPHSAAGPPPSPVLCLPGALPRMSEILRTPLSVLCPCHLCLCEGWGLHLLLLSR